MIAIGTAAFLRHRVRTCMRERGFEGSIVAVDFTEQPPQTTWNLAAPDEYGFYANVNPAVDHPRWSQKSERRLGELFKRPTLMFNGYPEVAPLYAGLDLRTFY